LLFTLRGWRTADAENPQAKTKHMKTTFLIARLLGSLTVRNAAEPLSSHADR
jgi:hypothetical protein